MNSPGTTQFQEYALPDGRVVSCTNKFNTAGVWQEFSDGLYARCIARLRPNDTVVDVGGHIGLTSLLVTDAVPDLRIIACEPAPPTFECLVQNFERHLPTAIAVNVAIGTQPGTTTLTYYPNSDVMSTLRVDDEDDRRNIEAALTSFGVSDERQRQFHLDRTKAGAVEYPVKVITLAHLFAEYHLKEVGLLKVDVERAELDVFRSLDDADWPGIRNIIAEVHDVDGQLAETVELLRDKGFHLDDLQQDMYDTGTTHMVTATRDLP
ncbi:FkbM family methyltransferase [Amycolatopsis sp. NPDC058986]|uniref:FkbM family methyltransferase n=1 Tax=unclassified Amycolatopsis TaxID=2618356 RepID=UPI00366E48F8